MLAFFIGLGIFVIGWLVGSDFAFHKGLSYGYNLCMEDVLKVTNELKENQKENVDEKVK